jgi:DNA-binding protein H-NS
MTTYQDLIAQKEALLRQQAELERQIAEQLKGQRAEAIAQIKAQMAEYGLTVADLADTPKRGRKPSETATGEAPRKVAAKYRDPATGATWSGRGLKPKWLAAALAEGRTLEDFAL